MINIEICCQDSKLKKIKNYPLEGLGDLVRKYRVFQTGTLLLSSGVLGSTECGLENLILKNVFTKSIDFCMKCVKKESQKRGFKSLI